MSEVSRKMAKGAVWMVLLKISERSIGFVSTIILARLLVPGDFGLIAMAMSIIVLLELLNSFGFDIALIHNQEADRADFDTAWTLDLVFGAVGALLLVLIADPAAWFYEDQRLAPVIYVLAFSFFIRGFQNVGIVAFRKELHFSKEFGFLLAKKAVAFSVTIPLALALESYWALVAGMLASNVTGVVLSYWMHPYRPRFSFASTSKLFNFSKWLFANNIIFFLQEYFSDFAIGKLVGSQTLGIYKIAYELASLPTTELVAPINRAVFPGYAKMSSDRSVLRQGFLDVISVITLAALPSGIGIALTAHLLVPVFLGEKWLDAIPIMEILAISGVFVALQTNTGSVYLALGRPKILTIVFGTRVALLIPCILWMVHQAGAVGAAWAMFGATLTVLPINYFLTFRLLELKVRDFLSFVWRPIMAAAIMVAAVRLSIDQWALGSSLFGQAGTLALAVCVGVSSYVISIMTLWGAKGCPDGAERYVVDRLLAAFRARVRWASP